MAVDGHPVNTLSEQQLINMMQGPSNSLVRLLFVSAAPSVSFSSEDCAYEVTLRRRPIATLATPTAPAHNAPNIKETRHFVPDEDASVLSSFSARILQPTVSNAFLACRAQVGAVTCLNLQHECYRSRQLLLYTRASYVGALV